MSNNTVSPEGSPDASIILIGEAPGRYEILSNRPFIGSAGRFLDELLNNADLCRDELYITNLSKKRVPQDKMSNVKQEILLIFQEELIKEINSLDNPKILIPLGDYPLQAISNKKGITKWRGSIIEPREEIKHDCIILPTFHPSSLHYGKNYKNWTLITADFSKAAMIRDADFTYEKPDYKFIIQPTFDQVLDTLTMLEKEKPFAVLDAETAGISLTALGLGWSRQDAISIPFIWGTGKEYWTEDQEFVIWRRLGEVLPKLDLGVQNVFFDWEIMANHHITLKTAVWDSMLMHACLWSEMRHRLDILISIYTNIPYYKTDEDDDKRRSTIKPGRERDFWSYNCLDCVGTLWCIEELKKELKEENMLSVYYDLFAELIEPFFQMNMRGVLIDADNLKESRKQLHSNVDDYVKRITEAAGEPVNVNSSKQVKRFLFETLGMKAYKDRSTGKESTNKKALTNLAHKYQSEIPTIILEERSDRRMLGLFSEENLSSDGRMRCSYNLAQTKTGRLASQKKKGSRKGLNLQNIKTGHARSLFVPDKGMIMIGGDGRQAEARVVAWYARDKAMMALFEGGQSIHKENAKNLFGRDVEKDEPEYKIAKALIHGANYGMGSLRFARTAGIPHNIAKDHLRIYHETYPGIRDTFHREVDEALLATRTLYNPFGRREIFLDRLESVSPEAYAFKPQSTVSDITKKAIKYLFRLGYVPLLELHDGIIIQTPIENKDQAIQDIRRAFDVPFEINGITCTIPIDVSVGMSWRDLEEIED